MPRTTALLRIAMLLALALTLALLASGCSASNPTAAPSTTTAAQPAPTSAPAPATLTDGDSGRTFKLAVGQKLTVRLVSNASTGYSWQATQTTGFAQVGEPVNDSPNKPGLVGAPGTQTLTFTADARGTHTLMLEYRRPWEKNVPAEKTWSVTVTVE